MSLLKIKFKFLGIIFFETLIQNLHACREFICIKSVAFTKTKENNISEDNIFKDTFLLHALINEDRGSLVDYFLYKTINELYSKKANLLQTYIFEEIEEDLHDIVELLISNKYILKEGKENLIKSEIYNELEQKIYDPWQLSLVSKIAGLVKYKLPSTITKDALGDIMFGSKIAASKRIKHFTNLIYFSFPAELKNLLIRHSKPDYDEIMKIFYRNELIDSWRNSNHFLDFKSIQENTVLLAFRNSKSKDAYEISVCFKKEPTLIDILDSTKKPLNSQGSEYDQPDCAERCGINYILRIKKSPLLPPVLCVNKIDLVTGNDLKEEHYDDYKEKNLKICNPENSKNYLELLDFLNKILSYDCSQDRDIFRKNKLDDGNLGVSTNIVNFVLFPWSLSV